MKRIKWVMLLFIVLFSCGCSNKLVCEKETIKEKSKIEISFIENKPETIKWNRKLIYDNKDAMIELDYLEQKHLLDALESKYFVYELEKNDRKNYIDIKMDITFDKLNKEIEFGLPVIDDTQDNNMIELQNHGYICK